MHRFLLQPLSPLSTLSLVKTCESRVTSSDWLPAKMSTPCRSPHGRRLILEARRQDPLLHVGLTLRAEGVNPDEQHLLLAPGGLAASRRRERPDRCGRRPVDLRWVASADSISLRAFGSSHLHVGVEHHFEVGALDPSRSPSRGLPRRRRHEALELDHVALAAHGPVLADAIVQATGAPDEYAGYAPGTPAVTLIDPQVPSYTLDVFGRCPRTTSCENPLSSVASLPGLAPGERAGDECQD